MDRGPAHPHRATEHRILSPVFIIHGRDDNVIPSSETPLVAADLARRGNHRVRWLLTPLLSHADLGGAAAAGDAWRLLSFWRQVLRVMDAAPGS